MKRNPSTSLMDSRSVHRSFAASPLGEDISAIVSIEFCAWYKAMKLRRVEKQWLCVIVAKRIPRQCKQSKFRVIQ